MRSWRRWRGQQGEQMAAEFLQRQGYRIQQQNYRCREGEIDSIAWDGPTLVFIEVKTKGQTLFDAPQAMVRGVFATSGLSHPAAELPLSRGRDRHHCLGWTDAGVHRGENQRAN